jgi:predicted RNase H-like nuclease
VKQPFTVVGIDAAWTPHNPSGVALLRFDGRRLEAMAAAPSYEAFLRGAFDWRERPNAGLCDVGALLQAAPRVACVAVDMALSPEPITRRREADRLVSRAFGRYGCATHSPSAKRPGKVSDDLRRAFEERGFRLRTPSGRTGARSLIEVYPHAALIRLMRADRRIPYKLARAGKYYPNESPAGRRTRLLRTWERIVAALKAEIPNIGDFLPTGLAGFRPSRLKAVEDTLDALICAWVGSEFVRGRADAYGDANGTIWIPRDRDGPSIPG